MTEPPSLWRPEFLDALRLLATVSDAMAVRGLSRPVLVGEAATAAEDAVAGQIPPSSPPTEDRPATG